MTNLIGGVWGHNTVLVASIIVQHAESAVYSLHWHLSDIQNDYSSTDTCGGKFSLLSLIAFQLHAAIVCHIQFTTPGLALGSNPIT